MLSISNSVSEFRIQHFKKIQFQMKHFNLSANTHMFFHSGEQCNFLRSPSKCEGRFPSPAQHSGVVLLKECPWNVWGSAWLPRQCFAQSNISYGIALFRTQTWRNGFHHANRMKWKSCAFSLFTISIQLHGLL